MSTAKHNEDYAYIEEILYSHFYSEGHVNPREDAKKLLGRALEYAAQEGLKSKP